MEDNARFKEWAAEAAPIDKCIKNNLDGYKFSVKDGYAALSLYTGQRRELIIPEKYGTKAVVAVTAGAFMLSSAAIESIVLPEGIIAIGELAFAECRALRRITIPKSVKSIGKFIFSGCSLLRELNYLGTQAQWDAIDKDSLWAYGGGNFKVSYIREDPPYCGAGQSADCEFQFQLTNETAILKSYVGSRTDITIPKKYCSKAVTKIGNAFENCAMLISVIIPEGIKEIGSKAFLGCYSLRCVTLPSSVERIGDGAFWNCASLERISIPEGVDELCAYTFSGCRSLCELSLPHSILKIGHNAFRECVMLKSISYNGSCEQWKSIDYNEWDLGNKEPLKVLCTDGILEVK